MSKKKTQCESNIFEKNCKCTERPLSGFECYEVKDICSTSTSKSQILLIFALRLAFSKIFAIFNFSICYNVKLNIYFFLILNSKIPRSNFVCVVKGEQLLRNGYNSVAEAAFWNEYFRQKSQVHWMTPKWLWTLQSKDILYVLNFQTIEVFALYIVYNGKFDIFKKTKQNKTFKILKVPIVVCENNWEENSGQVWKRTVICRRSGVFSCSRTLGPIFFVRGAGGSVSNFQKSPSLWSGGAEIAIWKKSHYVQIIATRTDAATDEFKFSCRAELKTTILQTITSLPSAPSATCTLTHSLSTQVTFKPPISVTCCSTCSSSGCC